MIEFTNREEARESRIRQCSQEAGKADRKSKKETGIDLLQLRFLHFLKGTFNI